jgi:hypothetical protein
MDYEKFIIVRGYDLFFRQASKQALIAICRELGDKSEYDIQEQKVTNMLTNDVLVELSKLEECHDIANTAGEYFDRKYDCDFVASELYLKMTEEQTKLFKNNRLCVVSSS